MLTILCHAIDTVENPVATQSMGHTLGSTWWEGWVQYHRLYKHGFPVFWSAVFTMAWYGNEYKYDVIAFCTNIILIYLFFEWYFDCFTKDIWLHWLPVIWLNIIQFELRWDIKQTLKCVHLLHKVCLPVVAISPKWPANQLTKKDIHQLLHYNNYVMIRLDVQIMPRNTSTYWSSRSCTRAKTMNKDCKPFQDINLWKTIPVTCRFIMFFYFFFSFKNFASWNYPFPTKCPDQWPPLGWVFKLCIFHSVAKMFS